MTPHYSDDWLTIYGGDCREVMASLPSDSVDCVVTSPPYWGLRDYGSDGQLGLERTPEEYVANMVAVFAEVRRVLKPSGTCWLNLGDSYGGGNGGDTRSGFNARYSGNDTGNDKPWQATDKQSETARQLPDRVKLKPKDLVGIPWRVAFALQADGWYLRSDIIWSKPNPMPESVTDRPTKSHEYLFLLTKNARYYFDADAVREGRTDSNGSRDAAIQRHGTTDGEPTAAAKLPDSPYHAHKGARRGLHGVGTTFVADPAGRNIRSVWTIATRPYPGAHFAVFPPELPERCIKAGSSERGVCPECGAPWERVVERTPMLVKPTPKREAWQATDDHARTQLGGTMVRAATSETTGWRSTCAHPPAELCKDKQCPLLSKGVWGHPISAHDSWGEPRLQPEPAVVLDPFGGSGTVGMVANRLSRRAILIDLNPEYLKQQMTRNSQVPLGLTEGDAA